MKHKIRFIKKCRVELEGEARSFELDQEIEVSEEGGRDLIQRHLAIPAGPQYGRPVRMLDRD
jgi:hypothetical protein